MTRARSVALVALLALAGGAELWYWRGPSSSKPSGQAPAGAESLSPAERVELLDNSLQAIADGLRDAPRDRWDPAYVVAQVGRSPDTLRQWVQENTAWIPYRGVLRGPVGVLMDRQGNSLDRAVLLAGLLTEAGHTARLAHAELPAERAWRELPDLASRRPGHASDDLASAAGPSAPVREVAARYELDGPAIERMLDAYEAGTARLLTDLDQRVSGQTTRLLSAVSGPDPAAEWRTRHDTALAALRDHWWVQVERGESWVDLDLLGSSSGDADRTALAPHETMSSSEIAPSLFHQIAVRVVEERLASGALTERRSLEHTLRPSELIGRPVVLQFWPTTWPQRAPSAQGSDRTTRQLALGQEEWSAALVTGSDVVARAVLGASADAGGPAPGLVGLGGAIASGLRAEGQPVQGEQDSLLTAVWIEYQIDVPGRQPRVLRRRVFDLIGPAARATWPPNRTVALDEGQRLTRSLSLMMRTEILPVVTQLAPEFVLHLGGKSLLANAGLLRAAARPDFGSDQHAADSILRQGEPGVSPLYTLAVLRQDALGERAFIDRPTILTRHQYPTARGDGIAVEDATDIVANEVGVVLGESDGFAVRVAQGVWDTNLEALLGAGSRAAANTALAYDAPGDWRVLTSSLQQRPASGLPADAARLLQQELDGGYTIVAPDAPVDLEGQEFAGWWRIHPETGDALGIAGNGWGQAAPDYTMHLAAFVEMAKPFVFTYALCQYIPQAANSLNILGNEFWRRGLSPSWTTRPEEGKDFEDVAVENNRKCVIEAILAGFVATAPLLMRTLRTLAYRTGTELSAEVRMGRNPALTKPSIERLPGMSPRPQGYPAPSGSPRSGTGPGAGTLPGGGRPGVDPLGKTDPGLPAAPPPAPTPGSAAQENLRKAAEALARIRSESWEATGEFIRYRGNRLNPNAPWDPNFDDQLQKKAWEMEQQEIRALNNLKAARHAARDAAGVSQGAQGRGGFPPPRQAPQAAPAPNPAGCPPNCGNANPTVPAAAVQVPGSQPKGALEVGSAGAASSFYPFSWPSGLKP